MPMIDDRLRFLDPRVPILLQNATCVYCNVVLTKKNSTKEHVVGRRFVPKGKLNQSWNLIVRACSECNGRKAALEDDLSAVTMQPDAWGQFAVDDSKLTAEARRKGAKSISRITKRPVDQSSTTIRVQVPMFGGSLSFDGVGPPQPDEGRAYELARMQLSGLFYWITFNPHTRRGGFWLGGFHPVHAVLRRDWGHVVQRAFADAVQSWEPRVLVTQVAGGFFRAVIRRHPKEVCWAWALEWNQNYRLLGFFGEESPARAVVGAFPVPTSATLAQGESRFVKMRREVELLEDEDLLFHCTAEID